MSRSIRFLGLAIMAWAGVRAISFGFLPGTRALALDLGASRPSVDVPPITPSVLPAVELASSNGWTEQQAASFAYDPSQAYHTNGPTYLPFPAYIPVSMPAAKSSPPQIIYLSQPAAMPQEMHYQEAGFAQAIPTQVLAQSTPALHRQSTPSFEAPKQRPGLDRVSLSSWAVVRNEGGPDSLANSGMLGGSEAGARLMWMFSPKLAASLRTSAPVNSQRGAEAALGLRYQPLQAWPVALTVERRHGFKYYGRNAFAMFAEGGVYGRPLPLQAALDGYFQAGIVDFNNPDWFVDGQLAVSRPVWRNLSAGFGAWGGAQPGLRRFDAGPRLSLDLGKGMRAHVDYRLNLAGNARPGSGATVTLAGDF